MFQQNNLASITFSMDNNMYTIYEQYLKTHLFNYLTHPKIFADDDESDIDYDYDRDNQFHVDDTTLERLSLFICKKCKP